MVYRKPQTAQNIDRFGRRINYLRISVTDRCNLRCRYCMPKDIPLIAHDEVLRFDEIVLIAEAAAKVGISHLKVTGGEPLVRKGTPALCKRLKAVEGIETVTLTTNGFLLEQFLPELIDAGIDGINISLDTLSREKYKNITGFDKLEDVKRAIHASIEAGIPTKINVAVMNGVNTDEIIPLAELAKEQKLHVRFIEMMPIGHGTEFKSFDNRSVLAKIREKYPDIARDEQVLGSGPAAYYHIPGFCGSIGFISAINHKFCDACNRMRLTSTGLLKYCLCFEDGIDLRSILRTEDSKKAFVGEGKAREEKKQKLEQAFRDAISMKPQEHCFDQKKQISEHHGMSQIGG